MYYYRKVRKMGLIEMAVILFIIITIGQYLVAWAAYFERKYTLVSTYLFIMPIFLFRRVLKMKIVVFVHYTHVCFYKNS